MKRQPVKLFLALLLGTLIASAGCLASDSGGGTPPVDDHGSGGTGGSTGSTGGTGTGGTGSGGTGSGTGTGTGTGDDGDDGTGGGNVCIVRQNDNEIRCTDGACLCFEAGQQVSTCTAPDPTSACSSPGNCCGF